MTCKIPYIENSGFDDSTKKMLTDAHIEIANEIFNHRFIKNKDGDFGDRVFIFHPDTGILTVGASQETVRHKEARKLISSINNRYGRDEIVTLVPVEGYESLLKVSIDVRKSKALTLGKNVNITDDDSTFQYLLNEYNRSNITRELDEFYELVVKPSESHNKLFDEILDNVNTLVIRGLNEERGVFSEYGFTRPNLIGLRKMLRSKTALDNVRGISKYITMSGWAVKNMQDKIDYIKNRLTSLDEITDVEERKDALSEISDYLRDSSYYYHLFAPLEDIKIELERIGINISSLDDYFKDVLEKNLELFLKENGLDEESILTILDSVPAKISDPNLLYIDIVNKIRESNPLFDAGNSFRTDFQNALKSAEKPNRSLYTQLAKNVTAFQVMQNDLKDLHYNVVTEVLYPVMDSVFEGKTEEFKEYAKDENWYLTKDDFKAFLKASEKDLTFIQFWLYAPINAKDLLVKTVSMYTKQMMMYVDREFKKNSGDMQEFLVNNNFHLFNEKQQEEVHNEMIWEALTVDDFTPIVDDDYDGPTRTFTILGKEQKYVARRSLHLIGEYDIHEYSHNKQAFMAVLPKVVEELNEKWDKDNLFGLVELEHSSDEYLKELYYKIYYRDRNGMRVISPKFKEALDEGLGENILHSSLQAIFYSKNLGVKDSDARNKIIESEGFDKNGDLKKSFLRKNSKKKAFNKNIVNYLLSEYPDTLFSYKGRYLVQYDDGEYAWLDVNKNNKLIIPDGKTVEYFFYNRGELSSLADRYKAENSQFASKWNRINSRTFTREYYKRLYGLYKKSNEYLGMQQLKYRELPQNNKSNTIVDSVQNLKDNLSTKEGFVNSVKSYFKAFLVEDDSEPLKNKQGQYINVDGEVLPDGAKPIYVSKINTNLDGTRKRSIPVRGVTKIPIDEIDTNLLRNILTFNGTTEVYNILNKNHSSVQLLKTLINGDVELGIDPRKVGFVDKKGNPTYEKGLGKLFGKTNPYTHRMIETVINDVFYNETVEDFKILDTLSAKKIVERLSKYTAFMSLAWNVSTMLPNYGISMINEASVAEGNKHWNKKDFAESEVIYWKNVVNGNFMKDLKKGYIIQKSILTQLLIEFDAIQGETISPEGKIETQGLAEKISSNALWWTMNIVEHANQTKSMIMLMKGYKMKDKNGADSTLWDLIMRDNVDGKRLKLPEEFTEEMYFDFKHKLQGMNRQIHGNYQKIDKTMLQHTILGPAIMMFRKWIVDGFRSRFQGADYDWELKDPIEGYFTSYMKDLSKEFIKLKNETGWLNALMRRGWKDIPMLLGKTFLGGLDSATFRLASKNSESVHKFLYSDASGEKLMAMYRATYEIGIMMILVLVGAGMQILRAGLDEDDEFADWSMMQIELLSRRLSSDLGFFISGTTTLATGEILPGMITFEQMLRMVKNPLVAYRTVDATAGIFAQLTDLKYGEDGMEWGLFDTYDRNGNNYKKGDYKIMKKIEKSFLAPYWQIIKFLNPSDQLKYMDMVFKYSK